MHTMKPNFENFCRQAKSYQLLSLSYQVPADRFTPISLFERFDDHRQAFLLESVVDGTHFARYSIMGRKQLIGVVLRDASAEVSVANERIVLEDASPTIFLKRLLSCINMPPAEDALPYRCALTGYFSYDFIRYFESLPDTNKDQLQLPVSALMAPEEVIIFDHLKNEAHLIVNVLSPVFSSDHLKTCLQQDKIANQISSSEVPPANHIQPIQVKAQSNDTHSHHSSSNSQSEDITTGYIADKSMPDTHSDAKAKNAQAKDFPDGKRPDDTIYTDVYHQAAGRLKTLYQALFIDPPEPAADQAYHHSSSINQTRSDQSKIQNSENITRTTQIAAHGQHEDAIVDHDADKDIFLANVRKAKQAIRSGEIFQVVLSKNFTIPCTSSAFSIYRALRAVNPSPYLFFLRIHPDAQPTSAQMSENKKQLATIRPKTKDYYGIGLSDDVKPTCLNSDVSFRTNGDETVLVGASPEMLIKRQGNKVETCPIAGTRPRGKTADEDDQMAKQLLADSKEAAEHAMLVDLSRNDIGRISQPGSVNVTRYRSVEKFSHVMHLVSLVEGKLSENLDSVDALAAVLPAGTLSGAPKIRAMEIIDALESARRGPYGGAVGYLGFDGLMDTCITIRTAVIKDRLIHIRSGAGIVADSDPEKEYQEVRQKARALMAAIEKAVLYQ